MTSFRPTLLAMTCVAGLLGCGSEVTSSGGDSGSTPDVTTTEASARDGGLDGPSLSDAGSNGDAGRDGDTGTVSDSCALLDVSLAGADAGDIVKSCGS
jgi:hypothetical protein